PSGGADQIVVAFPSFHASGRQDAYFIRCKAELAANGFTAPGRSGYFDRQVQHGTRDAGIAALQRGARELRVTDGEVRRLKRGEALEPVSVERVVHPEDKRNAAVANDVSEDGLNPRRMRDDNVEATLMQQRT